MFQIKSILFLNNKTDKLVWEMKKRSKESEINRDLKGMVDLFDAQFRDKSETEAVNQAQKILQAARPQFGHGFGAFLNRPMMAALEQRMPRLIPLTDLVQHISYVQIDDESNSVVTSALGNINSIIKDNLFETETVLGMVLHITAQEIDDFFRFLKSDMGAVAADLDKISRLGESAEVDRVQPVTHGNEASADQLYRVASLLNGPIWQQAHTEEQRRRFACLYGQAIDAEQATKMIAFLRSSMHQNWSRLQAHTEARIREIKIASAVKKEIRSLGQQVGLDVHFG